MRQGLTIPLTDLGTFYVHQAGLELIDICWSLPPKCKDLFLFISLNVFACMYICVMYKCSAHGGQKRILDLLELGKDSCELLDAHSNH